MGCFTRRNPSDSIEEGAIPISFPSRSSRRLLPLAACLLAAATQVSADPVPVRRTQGTAHGFLVLKTLEGATLAAGDLIQVAHGNRVTSRLTFHFRDGSLDDQTTVFTQRGVFRLVSNH